MPEVVHTTGSAARAAGCPEAYVRTLISRGIIVPLKDQSGRSLLTEADVEKIREHRATKFRTAA